MIRLLALLLVLGASAASAQGFKTPPDLVRASLVAEPVAIRGGEPFTIGIRMVMKPNWHVYWRNPGDSGLAPEVVWRLPAGFSAGAIQWPAPERIPVATLMNYGYAGETVLLVKVTPPPSLDPAEPVRMGGKLSYLVCDKECVPGTAELSLTLSAAASSKADPASSALFARARSALPQPSPWPVRLSTEGERLVVHLDAPGLVPDTIRAAAFFPYSETAIENAAEQIVSVDASGLRLALTRATPADPVPASLPGVVTLERLVDAAVIREAYAIGSEAPPAATTGQFPEAAPALAPIAQPSDPLTLLGAAGLALLGGLILNLMPCVFPVLSIKVLGLVRHSGENPARIRLHGLAYAAGVMASFLALAGLLIALKSGGAGIGWGFQLQSPIVVAALAYLLFAMGLSLSGVVHLGGGITGIGDGLTRRAGLQGSFFTGVLATVVATPCTAPFMGTAIGFALTQSAIESLIVFASLGLGLALPFLALTLLPRALRLLPRPGAWMDLLKQVLAFPIYLTVAWLIWVLAQQVGPRGLMLALFGLVIVAFAAWIWEAGRDRRPTTARIAQGLAVLAIAAAGALVVGLDQDRALPGTRASVEGIEPFTQARLDGLRADGKPVFVNMTAAWCITCQVNERTSLSGEAVRASLRARGVTYLKGDWTNQNPEITRLLERHGRSGVPLYLLYGEAAEPSVLPQILTESTVLAALETIKPAGPRSAALNDAARW